MASPATYTDVGEPGTVREIGEKHMNSATKKAAAATAEVYICPCDAGFILSVGPVCLWLERATAEDVLLNLRDALSGGSCSGDDGPNAN